MTEDFDKKKMIETLMDPDVSLILTELEDGEKDSVYLCKKLQISDEEIGKRLSYVIDHGFVKSRKNEKTILFSIDKKKLDKIMEADENFSSVVDGLTELDQYLN